MRRVTYESERQWLLDDGAVDRFIEEVQLFAQPHEGLDRETVRRVLEALQREQPKPGARPQVKLSPDGTGGVSRKPGNMLLNWQRLYETIPSIVVTVAGTEFATWLFPFVALLIWRDVVRQAEIKLNPTHAIAINAMWNGEDGNQRITESKAFMRTNLLLNSYDRPALTISAFNEIVDDLAAMRCLEVTEGVIWLLESVGGH
jgi:hypothetical protein